MNIQEATKKAMEEDAYITRKSKNRYGSYSIGVIKPSNSHDTCAGMSIRENGEIRSYIRNWNPTADDLMADDWEVVVVGENGLLPI